MGGLYYRGQGLISNLLCASSLSGKATDWTWNKNMGLPGARDRSWGGASWLEEICVPTIYKIFQALFDLGRLRYKRGPYRVERRKAARVKLVTVTITVLSKTTAVEQELQGLLCYWESSVLLLTFSVPPHTLHLLPLFLPLASSKTWGDLLKVTSR